VTTQLPIKTIKQGTYSGIGVKKLSEIQSSFDFSLLWNAHHARITPQPALPLVNFSKEMVIAVYAGTKSNAGYSITVEQVEDDGNLVTISYRERSPSGMTAAVMTQPFHLVTIPKTSKQIVFKRLP